MMNAITNQTISLIQRVGEFFPDLSFSADAFIRPSKEKLRDFIVTAFLEFRVYPEAIAHVFGQDTSYNIVPAINILCTLRYLFLIDESQVGLIDILNPSIDIMLFIVNQVMDFIECAENNYERLFSLADKYVDAKNTVKELSEEINSVLQTINATKMEIQEIQQAIVVSKKDYEDASGEHGEITKIVQIEQEKYRKANAKLEEAMGKKNELLKQMGKIKMQIGSLVSEDGDIFNDSIEDDYETLKSKLDEIIAQRELRSQLVNAKRETVNNLTKQLKQCTDNQKNCEEMRIMINKLSNQMEDINSRPPSDILSQEISSLEAQIVQNHREIIARKESIKSHEGKKAQMLSELSEANSSFASVADLVSDRKNELNKLNLIEKQKSANIVAKQKELLGGKGEIMQTKAHKKAEYCNIFVDIKNQLKQLTDLIHEMAD